MTDYETATAFIGEWGPFQQQQFFLLALSIIPNGFTALSIVFLADTPPHRCLIPEHINLTDAWRNSSIPLVVDTNSGDWVPSKCSRYKLEDVVSFSDRGLLPGADVNLSNVATEGCLHGWEYDRSVYTSTISTEWDLVCDDRWKNPMTSSLFFCGVLTGSFVSGQLSDRYGRKKVLLAALALQTLFMFIQVFSQSWTMFCALFFFVGLGQISNYVAAFVLGTEILGPRVRTIFSTAGVCLFFGAGYMLLPLFAFFIRDWRMLLLGLTVPGFLYVPYWWLIPESPRWLLSQGRIKEAEAIIRDAAKRNNIEPPSVIFSPLQTELQSEKRKAHNICDLLRSRNIRWISITLWLVWNSLTIAYFALSLNTANLYGNPYLNCFLSAVVEMPAYTLSWVMFRWWPRRLCLFSSLFMGGLFLFFIQLIPANLVYLAITFEMMGKFAVTAAFAIVYAYTAELFPTVLRNTAVGTCSMASRVGSIIAPYFIYLRSYSISLPYILMGCITVLSGLLSLLLPESYGMPLPETITHMQRFPGCCKKKPYALAHTEEKETAAEMSDEKSPAVS
ncbi:Solute carrier family 22 member 5 High-affinity sodium-dependent carnitine cotransporter [Collichthys lucidus]|uniref:Solute carrier family 22 member 5 High-affinity sodium-dependent carnitine cotransporter n=1 Tax=Collichthys lucidus TaxID=240159 RepID=A0A4U5V676_COLLU|nr:Solute carrier family 22 member 5 High-affinity sodium-dependent carnitine cotransporter [Collichthys lucidus]